MIRFMPDTWQDAVLRPIAMALPDGGVYVETIAPDLRFVFVLLLLVGWLVFRVRGNTAIFPLLIRDVVDDSTKSVLLGGNLAAIRAALVDKGPIAMAITAPVFVDFDGNGYRAPFAP